MKNVVESYVAKKAPKNKEEYSTVHHSKMEIRLEFFNDCSFPAMLYLW